MINSALPVKDIEKIAYGILHGSKSLGVFPTPIDSIIKYSELQVSKNIDLSKIHPGFITKNKELLLKALKKVLGAIDIRQKKIYLDMSVNHSKQKFIKLHETGHGVLPWQKETLSYLDDEKTLDPETKEQFEQEANFFASATLFQLTRFEEEAQKLPLHLKSAMALAQKFGSSKHAAIRRYVEYSSKRCAVVVLETKETDNVLVKNIGIRNIFQSKSFTLEFEIVNWQNVITLNPSLLMDISIGKRYREDGNMKWKIQNKLIRFNYHLFNNSYNVFIFIFPEGEMIKSKVQIITV